MYRVIFEPTGLQTETEKGMNLLMLIQSMNLPLEAACGGNHSCGKCKVRVQGCTQPFTEKEQYFLTEEEKKEGIRLACEILIEENLIVEFSERGRADDTVIVTEMRKHWQDDDGKAGNVKSESELTAGKVCFGAAVDIGTTTLASYLYDLNTGKQHGSACCLNPQIPYGDDVISRIAYVCNGTEEEQERQLKKLQSLILTSVNELLRKMAEESDILSEQIVKLVLAGNTVMEHIFLGISPKTLGYAPFTPAVKELKKICARDLELSMYPEGEVWFLPAAAGFVGADHMAALTAVDPLQYPGNILVIDIGTNSEICLCSQGKLYVTSCATGPALEGAQIRYGMRASKGAIDRVWINPVTLEPKVHILGEETDTCISAVGICGSGIIDAAAQLVKSGVVQSNGTFSGRAVSWRIRENERGEKEYLLYQKNTEKGTLEVTITQGDLRAIQLAKAALYAGIQILFQKSGNPVIDKIILAGGFGCYIDIRNAQILGMLPDCETEKIQAVGNAAGEGASMALLKKEAMEKAQDYASRVVFVESANEQSFPHIYADAMAYPNHRDTFPVSGHLNWSCPGEDRHFLPDSVFQKGFECLENSKEILEMLPLIAAYNQESGLILPVVQNQEACILGAGISKKAGYWAPGDYPFSSLEEAEQHLLELGKGCLIHDLRTKALLEVIPYLKERLFYIEVQSPFSILTALVDPRKVYAALRRKNTECLERILTFLSEETALYIEAMIKAGCTLISIADPMGNLRLNGEKIYREWIGPWEIKLLKRCRRFLKPAALHLCGHMAANLINTGFATPHPIRLMADKNYQENLVELSKDPKIRYIGPGCLRCTDRQQVLAYELTIE